MYNYNTTSGKLDSPVTICDTLPGSKDHNSGRIIIAPIGGINYLFYSSGDMGSGQYENLTRPVNVQDPGSYEGKILRFNLEEDGDPVQNVGVRNVNYNRWIPSGAGVAGNPYNSYLGVQSAVWNMGHRNVQGFATATFGGTDYIFGSSHGPFSDDEINVMEAGKNYGHPLVIGKSSDGNYNQAKAGPSNGSLPFLSATGEADNVVAINALPFGNGYKDPLYTFYPVPKGSTTTCSSSPNQYYIQDIYRNCAGTGTNNFWKSEAPSGLGIYTSSVIPGWKNSFLLASLKWGRLLRVKLNSTITGLTTVDGVVDTMPYFESRNRYRDMAISPDGRDLFIVMDKSLSTSGPSQDNPTTLNCTGCVVKYSFLGYNDNAGNSTISTSIPIAPGVNNALTYTTTTNINADNNNLWVPITDSLGNIVAEIDANSNNLGTVTASLYKNSGTIRTSPTGKPYMDRSITINVQNQPAAGNPVNVRLYITATELASLVAAPSSGVLNISDVNVFKNTDPDGTSLAAMPENITPSARTTFGSNYVLKASIKGFSTFYFAGNASVLPVTLL
jgi:glucose/arabinose dehydrogenase